MLHCSIDTILRDCLSKTGFYTVYFELHLEARSNLQIHTHSYIHMLPFYVPQKSSNKKLEKNSSMGFTIFLPTSFHS